MEVDLGALDELLSTAKLDGYLLRADGDDADQRYLSGFPGPDPFLTLYANGRLHLLVRGLDRGLARNESRAETVATGADYGQRSLIEEHGRTEADRRVVARFLTDHDVTSVAVPTDFPIGTADGLRANEVTVRTDEEDTIRSIRATKTDVEIDHIVEAQRATEAAMARAESMLQSARIDGDMLISESEPLTSERIKEEIEVTLLRHRCVTEETIVAGGADAANPHDRGSGPLLPNEPIVIDIFPRHRDSKYHADMTRTFCVGEPTETARDYYELTHEVLRTAIDRLEPGVTGAAVHDSVCDVYEDAGVRTTRTDESAETGFIHGTGHGVGLEVHELPRLSTGGETLETGQVVTVEPGVYDPAFGGIRIEDLVVITPDGCRNLTEYGTEFVL